MRLYEIEQKERGTLLASIDWSLEVASNKSPYLKAKLNHQDGELVVNIWDNEEMYLKLQEVPKGAILSLEINYLGQKGKYKNYSITSFEIKKKEKITKVVEEEVIKEKLREIFNVVKELDVNLYSLIISIYKDERISDKIFTAPSSEKSGYNFKAGNATHTLRLCYLCEAIANVYNSWELNLDTNSKLSLPLLYTASIIANVGNAITLEMVDDCVMKTFEGDLHESSLLTLEILSKYLETSKITDVQKSLLKHIIASSKEKLTFGAIETPRTREANIFALAQRMDFLMGTFETMDRESLGDFFQIHKKTYCLLNY